MLRMPELLILLLLLSVSVPPPLMMQVPALPTATPSCINELALITELEPAFKFMLVVAPLPATVELLILSVPPLSAVIKSLSVSL